MHICPAKFLRISIYEPSRCAHIIMIFLYDPSNLAWHTKKYYLFIDQVIKR